VISSQFRVRVYGEDEERRRGDGVKREKGG